MSKILSFWVLVESLWELGAFGHPYFAFGVLWGILWDLWESFWIPWGTCWKHFGILWHPFGNFLGILGVYRVCPKGGGAPLGRPDCGSLVILWGFLGTLWEPFVGILGHRHTDIQTGPDQTRPDKRPDQTRGQTRGYTRDLTDRQIRDQSRAEKPLQSRAVPKCFPFRC